MNRVNSIELVWFDDGRGNLVLEHNEKSFTGVAVSYHANGILSDEQMYFNGIAHGLHKEYHSSGMVKLAGEVELGIREGAWQSWYESGQTECIEEYAKGYVLSRKRWDAQGNLTVEEKLNQNETTQQLINLSREIASKILEKDPSKWYDAN
jgi:antitoxin component YwqK of YwqJK toxin-antitoxin module